MLITIYPYKINSASSLALKNALIAANPEDRVHRVRSTALLPNNPERLIINWGNAQVPNFPMIGKVLNPVASVNLAGNKLLSFQKFEQSGVLTPRFTESREEAIEWSREVPIVSRTVLRGHSGEGIVITDINEVPPQAPLYVAYKKKRHEFRVHVFDGMIIDIQQKKMERGVEGIENRAKIRNRANGWVFCRDDLDLEAHQYQIISELARSAVAALSLDFGAVDIIYNQRENLFYALEVNTAPGLEGQTLYNYVEAVQNFIGRN